MGNITKPHQEEGTRTLKILENRLRDHLKTLLIVSKALYLVFLHVIPKLDIIIIRTFNVYALKARSIYSIFNDF